MLSYDWVFCSTRLCYVCVCECATNVAVKVLLRNTTMSLMRLPNEFHFVLYECVRVLALKLNLNAQVRTC